jgi:hypothetical protein
MTDVTFTIPIFYDHPDRETNLARVVKYLRSNISTNILIGEQGGTHFSTGEGYKYISFPGMVTFHRTKMLNQMALATPSPILVNQDADVIIPLIQLLQAVTLCRKGVGMVLPYDGRFARIPKDKHSLPLHELDPDKLPCSQPGCTLSTGGCVFFRRDDFFKGGGENEHFISYGPEDTERYERFGRIGVDVRRVKGVLWHYDHYMGINSGFSNPYCSNNYAELSRIREMSNQRLKGYIASWSWNKKTPA